MAKIQSIAKSRKAQRCKGGHELPVGSAYLKMERGFGGPTIIGCALHPIKHWEGSSSKMVAVYELQDSLNPVSLEDCQDALRSLAETAREVAGEYQDVQEGPAAEACQEFGSELESWADELEAAADSLEGDIKNDIGTDDLPPNAPIEQLAAYWESKVEDLNDAAQQIFQEKAGEMPEPSF